MGQTNAAQKQISLTGNGSTEVGGTKKKMKKGKKKNRSPLKFRIFLDSFVFIKFTLEYLHQNLRGPMQEKYKNALVTNNLYKSGKIKPMSRTCMCGVIKNFGIKKFDSNFNLIVKFLV